ncbi:hypothetical protein BH09ACT1_BH09ACT1_08700 [soil metagenome]
MIPISTEAGPQKRTAKGFHRTLLATILVLVLLAVTFVTLDYFQGPKLSSASIDTTQAVSQSGQQLRLFSNENLADVPARNVHITPAVGHSVSTTGQIIAVVFTQRLRYATTYTVRIDGVTSIYQNRPERFTHTFTTAAASVEYLDRADPKVGGDDRIVRTGLVGSASTVVYSAPKIEAFATFPAATAVVTADSDGTSSLSLVSEDRLKIEPLELPAAGMIRNLQASPDAGLLGFEFTSADPTAGYHDTLLAVDLTGAHTILPVLGVGGKPLEVDGWSFLSGSTKVVAHTVDNAVVVVDVTSPTSVTPLGQFAKLDGGSPDGGSVVIADSLSRLVYRLADGTKTRLPVLEWGKQQTFGGGVVLLDGTSRIQQVVVQNAGNYTSYIVAEKGKRVRIVYRNEVAGGAIDGFSVSPNGQYLAVTVDPNVSTSVSDGYAVDARPTSVTTYVVDIATSSVLRSFAGFDVDW